MIGKLVPAIHFGHQAQVAIVDNFTEKDFDVDGDGVADLSHGQMMERYIQAYHPQTTFQRFEMPYSGQQNGDVFLRHLKTLSQQVASGKQFDGLNLSLGEEIPFTTLSFESGKPLTPEDLPQIKKSLVKILTNTPGSNSPELQTITHHLTQLAQRGVPPYVGAGNKGSGYFNLVGLADDIIHVGATDAQGQKTPYSHDHPLVNRFEQGSFTIHQGVGGFDINEDGTPDVAYHEVSGGLPLVDCFVGKPLAEVEATAQDIATLLDMLKGTPSSSLPVTHQRLFPIDTLLNMAQTQPNLKLDVAELTEMRAIGTHFLLSGQEPLIFKTQDNPEKTVFFEPLTSLSKPVTRVYGASIATAVALGKDLVKAHKAPIAH